MKKTFTLSILASILPLLMAASERPSTALTFLQNKGQWNSDILYQVVNSSMHVYLLEDRLSFTLQGEEVEDENGNDIYPFLVWNMRFMNVSDHMKISGEQGKPSVYSWLTGNDPEKWIVHPNEYREIVYN